MIFWRTGIYYYILDFLEPYPGLFVTLKSRVIIIVLKNKPTSFVSLTATLISDFVISLLIFFISAAAFQAIIIIFFVSPSMTAQSLKSMFVLISIFAPIIFGLEILLLLPHGIIFLAVPFANLFWASIVPAIWLWIYIIAALVARVAVRNQKFLIAAGQLFDVENVPFTFLGFLAGTTGAFVAVEILIIGTIVQVIP